MTAIGSIHTIASVLALCSGAAVFLMRKGTRRHRRVGWVYVVSMIVLNGSALLIYRLFGRFGPFHAGAVLSLVSVCVGTWWAVAMRGARRQQALERHYTWMAFSYVGLAAAAVSEIVTRLPALRPSPGDQMLFGIAVGIASVLVVIVGGVTVLRARASQLRPFR